MDTPGLKKAMDTLEFLSHSKEARELALAREKELRDKASQIKSARDSGREEGREEGRKEGRKEGKEEGKIEVARNLLMSGMTFTQIAKLTNLPEEKIQKLKEELQ